MVNRHEALARARELLDEFDLHDWDAKLDPRATRRLGQCRPARREIGLSTKLIELNGWDVVEDVIRHEIAHALAPVTSGHDEVWKSWCRVTGANPTRCYEDEVVTPPRRWRLTCDSCDVQIFRDRVPRNRGPLGHRGCDGTIVVKRNQTQTQAA